MGRVGSLELHADAFTLNFQNQVKFRTAVNRIEPGLFWLLGLKDFFERETFPRRAEFWIGKQVGGGLDAAKGMVDAGVAEIDFGSFDKTFPEISMPRQ